MCNLNIPCDDLPTEQRINLDFGIWMYQTVKEAWECWYHQKLHGINTFQIRLNQKYITLLGAKIVLQV